MTTATRTLSVQAMADAIQVSVHPSLLELGPLGCVTDYDGSRRWAARMLTRLEMPFSISGWGMNWIDYETAEEAAEACDRARRLVLSASTSEEAFAALKRFYDAE